MKPGVTEPVKTCPNVPVVVVPVIASSIVSLYRNHRSININYCTFNTMSHHGQQVDKTQEGFAGVTASAACGNRAVHHVHFVVSTSQPFRVQVHSHEDIYSITKKIKKEVEPRLDEYAVNEIKLFPSEDGDQLYPMEQWTTDVTWGTYNNPLTVMVQKIDIGTSFGGIFLFIISCALRLLLTMSSVTIKIH
jgi:hypothetical protein